MPVASLYDIEGCGERTRDVQKAIENARVMAFDCLDEPRGPQYSAYAPMFKSAYAAQTVQNAFVQVTRVQSQSQRIVFRCAACPKGCSSPRGGQTSAECDIPQANGRTIHICPDFFDQPSGMSRGDSSYCPSIVGNVYVSDPRREVFERRQPHLVLNAILESHFGPGKPFQDIANGLNAAVKRNVVYSLKNSTDYVFFAQRKFVPNASQVTAGDPFANSTWLSRSSSYIQLRQQSEHPSSSLGGVDIRKFNERFQQYRRICPT